MKNALARLLPAGLARNSAFNLGSHAVAVLAALVCIPIAFRQLGPERFGLLMLIWGLLSYAIVFDLGTGPAVARATAASLVRDEGRRIRAIVRAGSALQLALGSAAALVILLLAPVLLGWLNVPAEYRADARLALYAVAAALPVVLIAQSLQAALEGLERFDLVASVRTPVAVLTYAIPAWGAVAGWSLARMMVFILVTRAAAILALYRLYRSARPRGQEGAARAELPALFRFGRWLALTGVLTQLLTYLDRYLLGGLHGLGAVAQYAAPYDAASKLLLLPGSIAVALFPGLSKDAARARGGDAGVRSRAAGRATMLLLVPVCALLILLAGPLLRLWLGPQLSADGVLAFRILLLATALHAAAYPPVILIEAFGRSDVVARYHLLELFIYVPAAVLLIWRFGVAGAAWAWVARSAALAAWSTWYARRYHAPAAASQYAHAD